MEIRMRPSRVLRKLRAGQVASCFKLNLADPRAAEIAAMSGFDCIWLCLEHIPTDWSALENQIRGAKVWDVDSIVRVGRGAYSDYVRPLEADAAGIMVPHLMSLAQAREVVRMTKFHPIGRRPVDSGNVDGAFCGIPLPEYIRQANEQRFVCVQIEDPEPLDELDEIAALEGVDMLFFGPADFSHGIGAPGEWDHPAIREARKRIAEVCAAHGKVAGTVASPETLRQTVDMGYRFVCMGADVLGLSHYCRDLASAYEAL